MSSWDQKSFRPSGKCQPTFSNDRTTVARPVHIPDYIFDQQTPHPELTKEIGLIFEWDNGEHLAPNISCHLSVGGETQVYGSLDGGKLFCRAPPGKYEAQLLENFDAQEKLREGRQKLKEALDKIIESEKEEAAKLQKIQEGRSDISNHAHLLLAVGRGYFHSAWGLVKSVKEVSDLVNPFTQLSNALTSAWTAKRADGKSWIQSYLDTYSEEQHRELAEALGFDYRKVTREQLAEAYNIACFIYDDAPSRQILEEFVKVYIEVQNPEEVAEFSGGVAFEIVLSALLIVFTGGVGLAARAALSARLVGLLKPLGEALRDLATFIVKATIKSAPRVKGMTGTGAVTVTMRRPKEILTNQISTPKAGGAGGAARAAQYAANWPEADLNSAISKFSGQHPVISTTEKGKKIYKNPNNGVEIVEDVNGHYFRIYDPSKPGKRKYLDLEGEVPTNKILPNGKQIGRTQSEYNEVTHFKKERQE